jgi:hypothetical protein
MMFCIMGFAGAQMAHAISATGGNTTNTVGSYRIHTFTNSGAFNVISGGSVEVLVVGGGGGGGGSSYGSGGGAGGLIYTNALPLGDGSNVTVTVGGGGAAGSTGANGNNSVFGPLIALGGGGGGPNSNSNGGNGGSGGGAYGTFSGTVGAGLQPSSASGGFGNSGGKPATASGGGGGGAGFAGNGGGGGDGRAYSICGTGSVYYAGGGAGAGTTTTSLGGGGNSVASGSPATAGAPNSGGGGGGGWNAAGGKGGSGIVIVRYLLSAAGAPVILNAAVSNITYGAAFFNGSVLSTGAAPVTAVSVYWGTADGGTNASLWANTNALAGSLWNQGDVVTANIGGLSPNTTYFYTFAANNASGTMFATPSTSFLSVGAPSVVNAGVVSNNVTLAMLKGQVTSGNPTPAVYVCWGTTDAGTSSTSAWQNVTSGGTQAGVFAVIATNLTTIGPYYYRCYATNTGGEGWAPTAVKFMEGQRVALMAAWKIPTNSITTAGVLDPTFQTAATNGTLVIYTNSQVDAWLNSGSTWYNYGTYGAASSYKGLCLYGFALTNLPRFVGATINRAQFLLYQSNGNSGNYRGSCKTPREARLRRPSRGVL